MAVLAYFASKLQHWYAYIPWNAVECGSNCLDGFHQAIFSRGGNAPTAVLRVTALGNSYRRILGGVL
ncbi:hypothetical protein K7402_23565, partial [Pseudomonas fluorescens group sp.]|uniref:hypothetical protein n=1 Tax=Pseudomonas fluorescens group sp. TaxID=2810293 RepID=UPI001CCAE8C2